MSSAVNPTAPNCDLCNQNGGQVVRYVIVKSTDVQVALGLLCHPLFVRDTEVNHDNDTTAGLPRPARVGRAPKESGHSADDARKLPVVPARVWC